MRKRKKIYFFGLLLMLILFTLTGCQSTEKEAYLSTGADFKYTCQYNAAENATRINWTTTFTNNSIYNISSVSVCFDLYNGNTLIKQDDKKSYSIEVKHGEESFERCYFDVEGEITKIEYKSWSADFSSFWDTYKIWFIVTIVIACLAAIIYIIVMIVNDLELDDIGDILCDYWWILLIILVGPVGSGIFSMVTTNWVPVVIVVGGLVAVVLIVLLAHLIKYIVEEASFSFGGGGYGFTSNSFEEGVDGDVSDYVDDPDSLAFFSVSELKEYCRENRIKGYSSLNKADLIDLIVDESSEEIAENNDSKVESSEIKQSKKKVVSYKSNITFADIAGLEIVKEAFRDKVILPFEHPEIFEKFGKKAGGGILLYGLPGTGKTMFAEACSNEIDAKFFSIKCSDIKSKWYGESEQKVKQIFANARKEKKAIIFFDEFEAIGAKRTDNSENGNNDLVPQILAEMQGVGTSKTNSTIVVIAATNKPWMIDSAFLRPGRFDEKIYVPLPDVVARKKLFELQLKKLPVADNLDYDYLAKITDGFNGADIKEFCEKLKMSAIKDSLEKGKEQTIGMDDVACVEGTVRSSVNAEEISKLKEFEENY
ncbi:MAG: AAA family ATPase [Anaeroplasma bactoclasticum]|nr:AAA family ATPase [Anaeroplasma bactoclasticum]MCM1557345.1 AAA family ATPase [Anaeroplasma bactoclasticum]